MGLAYRLAIPQGAVQLTGWRVTWWREEGVARSEKRESATAFRFSVCPKSRQPSGANEFTHEIVQIGRDRTQFIVWPISHLNANLPKRRFASIPESSWQDLIRTYRRPTVSVFSDRHDLHFAPLFSLLTLAPYPFSPSPPPPPASLTSPPLTEVVILSYRSCRPRQFCRFSGLSQLWGRCQFQESRKTQ